VRVGEVVYGFSPVFDQREVFVVGTDRDEAEAAASALGKRVPCFLVEIRPVQEFKPREGT
jgi:hypothetical protein